MVTDAMIVDDFGSGSNSRLFSSDNSTIDDFSFNGVVVDNSCSSGDEWWRSRSNKGSFIDKVSIFGTYSDDSILGFFGAGNWSSPDGFNDLDVGVFLSGVVGGDVVGDDDDGRDDDNGGGRRR